MDQAEIIARVNELSGGRPILISLSGGNPALQPLGSLIAFGRGSGHTFAMETQGSVAKEWFANLDWLILSPKPPSSGMSTDWTALSNCIEFAASNTECVAKIVVFDERDYCYAQEVRERFPTLKIFLQIGNPTFSAEQPNYPDLISRFRWLIERTITDQWFEATVLPQLHVLTWGNKRGA
jgi:7-carboxy-7-deazaguanine synthase